MNILAIDQGTSGTKAIVVAPDGAVLGRARSRSRPCGAGGAVDRTRSSSWTRCWPRAAARCWTPAPRWAPSGSPTRARRCCAGIPRRAARWGRRSAGRTAAPSTVTRELAAHAERLEALTGLPLDPYFAAPKMTWLRRRTGAGGVITTIDAWLNFQLTGRSVTDAATASRTLLLDLDATAWSAEACSLFELDPGELPRSSTAPRRWATPRRSGARCPSPAWPSISRPRCSPSPASRRARRSAPTAPARSCSRPRGRRRRARPTGSPRAWPGASAARPPTAWTGRSTPPGPPCRGWNGWA